jgi:hypothetical protein
MAMSLVAAAAASAEPLFNPSTGNLTAKSGVAKLAAGGAEIECTESTAPGTITNPHLVQLTIHFLGCTGKESGGSTCNIHSKGSSVENLISTNTLHGILGLVLPHTPALLILPGSGSTFVTLEGTCILTNAVTGSVAAEVTPVGSKQTTGKIVTGSGVNTHFESSLGGLVIARLVAFSTTATQTETASVEYEKATEVT